MDSKRSKALCTALAVILLLSMPLSLLTSSPVAEPLIKAHIWTLGDWNTWTGSGADNNASTSGNWENGSIENNDFLCWKSSANKNCSFNVIGNYAGFVMKDYAGNCSIKVNLTVNYTVINATENDTDPHDFNLWTDANLTWTQTGDYWHLSGFIPTHLFNVIWDGNLTFYQEAVTSQMGEHGMIGLYGWVANRWTITSGHELKYYAGGLLSSDGGGALNLTIQPNATLTILPAGVLYPCLTYPGVSDYQNTPYYCKYNFSNLGLIQAPGGLGSASFGFAFDGVAAPDQNEKITLGNITCPVICNIIYGGNWTIYPNYPTAGFDLCGAAQGWGRSDYILAGDWNITGNLGVCDTLGTGAQYYQPVGYEMTISGTLRMKGGSSFYQNDTISVTGAFSNYGTFHQNATLICGADFNNFGSYYQGSDTVFTCVDFTLRTNTDFYTDNYSTIIINGQWSSWTGGTLPRLHGYPNIICNRNTGTAATIKISNIQYLHNVLINGNYKITANLRLSGWLNFSRNASFDIDTYSVTVNAANITVENWTISHDANMLLIWPSTPNHLKIKSSAAISTNILYRNISWVAVCDTTLTLSVSVYNFSIENGIALTFTESGMTSFNITLTGLLANWSYEQLINAYSNQTFETDANGTVAFSYANSSLTEFSLIAQEISAPIIPGDNDTAGFPYPIALIIMCGGAVGVVAGLFTGRLELIIIGLIAIGGGAIVGGLLFPEVFAVVY